MAQNSLCPSYGCFLLPLRFVTSSLTPEHISMGELTYIKTTLGAILVGSMFAMALSGMTAIQTFLYYRLYPNDPLRLRLLVIAVWLFDSTHAALMCVSIWDYLILNFGNESVVDVIPMSLALTVALTAIITFITHIFFSHRVLRLSKNNWYITAPLILLSFLRLGASLVSTIEMEKFRSFHKFVEAYGYVFTLGLAIACTLDVVIAGAMCYFLQMSRTGFGEMDHVIDVIMVYTVNNGALTCITTVVSLICWLTMPANLVFLGLHFAISKLYANSLLGTLNSRQSLRHHRTKRGGDGEHALPVLFPSSFSQTRRRPFQSSVPSQGEVEPVGKLEISVEKTIQCEVDDGHSQSPA
ncbi:hypothetical protein BC826DRAFT_720340 [Russula brevipes]|nr:hypothetical protein BC826DRAFT_720340 [Russula brevipes]